MQIKLAVIATINVRSNDSNGSLYLGGDLPSRLAKNGTRPNNLWLRMHKDAPLLQVTWVMGSSKRGFYIASKGQIFPTGDINQTIELLEAKES